MALPGSDPFAPLDPSVLSSVQSYANKTPGLGATYGDLPNLAGNNFTAASPNMTDQPSYSFNDAGKTYYYVPQSFSTHGGTEALPADTAASLGGSPFSLKGTSYQPGNYGAPGTSTSSAGYIFGYNPWNRLPSPGTAGSGYTPGKSRGDIAELATIGSFLVPGVAGIAGVPGPFGPGSTALAGGGAAASAPAASGELGGLALPAGTAASGLPVAGGVSTVAPAAGEQALAGALATAQPGGALAPAALSGGAANASPLAFTDPSVYASPMEVATQGVNQSAATAAGGGVFGAGGVLGTGLTPGQAAVLGGGLGAGLLLGNRKIPQAGQLGAETALQPDAIANLKSAQAGNITPSQQAQIDKFTTDQISASSQYLENAGMGGIFKDPKTGQYTADSTSGLQLLANIKQQALAMQQGFSDQLFSQSIQELGVSDSATQTLINLELARQAQTGQALSSFMMSYGLLGGFGG
jgi:hypothetical protein